ncbi:hypothetical protein ACFU5Z_08295 [Streptomyces sp. NPDC057521]
MLHDLYLDIVHGLLAELPSAAVVALGTTLVQWLRSRRAKDRKPQ